MVLPSCECNSAFLNKSCRIFSVSPGWGLNKSEHWAIKSRQLSREVPWILLGFSVLCAAFLIKAVLPHPEGPLTRKPCRLIPEPFQN